jgi:hypothetical protein
MNGKLKKQNLLLTNLILFQTLILNLFNRIPYLWFDSSGTF